MAVDRQNAMLMSESIMVAIAFQVYFKECMSASGHLHIPLNVEVAYKHRTSSADTGDVIDKLSRDTPIDTSTLGDSDLPQANPLSPRRLVFQSYHFFRFALQCCTCS